ncbi:MAG: S8/S53 family peptidase [Jiangellales bacterium]
MNDQIKARHSYAEAFRTLVESTEEIALHDEPGREVLYRRGELVCATEDADRVASTLKRVLPGYADGLRLKEWAVGVTTLSFAPERSVLDAVATLRKAWQQQPDPAPTLQPHHVTVGYPVIMGHPANPPLPLAAAPAPPDAAQSHVGRGVTVGVCDTGIWAKAPGAHPGWFAGRYRREADDLDVLGDPGQHLAMQAGHGTFVAGIVRATAPGVRLDPEKALEPSGLGTELMLATALGDLEPGVEVVNLSLGCLTLDNLPSLPIARALQKLCRDVVVVAAAGNSGSRRPSWPAAFTGVIAVAAVTQDSDGSVVPDPDSNHGPWVDACAEGTHAGTFVAGTSLLPGLGLSTFDPPYASWSGTSFAAPVVAGRVADMMTRHGVPARAAAQILLDHPRWHPDYGVLVQ